MHQAAAAARGYRAAPVNRLLSFRGSWLQLGGCLCCCCCLTPDDVLLVLPREPPAMHHAAVGGACSRLYMRGDTRALLLRPARNCPSSGTNFPVTCVGYTLSLGFFLFYSRLTCTIFIGFSLLGVVRGVWWILGWLDDFLFVGGIAVAILGNIVKSVVSLSRVHAAAG